MVMQALSSLDILKKQWEEYVAQGIHKGTNDFEIGTASILNKIEVDREHTISQIIDLNQGQTTVPETTHQLLDKAIWNKAGYQLTKSNFTNNTEAMSIVKLIPLRMYRLVNDTKRDLLIGRGGSSDKMRTRIHTGVPYISEIRSVLNHDILQENLGIDSNICFYSNLNVLSQLASDIDIISAKVATLEMMTAVDSHLHSSIISIGKQIEL